MFTKGKRKRKEKQNVDQLLILSSKVRSVNTKYAAHHRMMTCFSCDLNLSKRKTKSICFDLFVCVNYLMRD